MFNFGAKSQSQKITTLFFIIETVLLQELMFLLLEKYKILLKYDLKIKIQLRN